MLIVDRVSYSYQEKPILNSISFQLKPGETVALMGPSGAGKTTLFKPIAGLLIPKEGMCLLNSPISPTVAYMTQEDLLLPWRTALDNVLLGKEIGKHTLPSHNDRIAALQLLRQVGLQGYENSLPSALSGGMRQRVALARTLLQNRLLLLLDEPFGALDVEHREQMYSLLKNNTKQHHQTLFLITHDGHDVVTLADRLFILQEGILSEPWIIPKGDPRQKGEFLEQLRNRLKTHLMREESYLG